MHSNACQVDMTYVHTYTFFIRSIVCLSFLRNLNATLKEEKAITDQPVVNYSYETDINQACNKYLI
jgi:hypothetical protein